MDLRTVKHWPVLLWMGAVVTSHALSGDETESCQAESYSHPMEYCCAPKEGCCGMPMQFRAELLAVKPCFQDTVFISTESRASSSTSGVFQQENRHLEMGWDGGFRLGLNFGSAATVSAEFTYFSGQTSESVAIDNELWRYTPRLGGMTVSESPQVFPTTRTTVDYDYTVLDVVASRCCDFFRCVEIAPFIGFRGFWFESETKERNTDPSGFSYSPEGSPQSVMHSYKAYGAVVGLLAKAPLYYGFDFVGRFAVARVGGHQDSRIDTESFRPVTVLFENTVNLDKRMIGSTAFEGKLALLYGCCICDKPVDFGIHYEHAVWKGIPKPLDSSGETGKFEYSAVGIIAQLQF